MAVNMAVNLGGLAMKNPVTTGSGTFGSGMQFADSSTCQNLEP